MSIKAGPWEGNYERDDKGRPESISIRRHGSEIEAGDLRAVLDNLGGAPWTGAELVNRLRELSFGDLGSKLPGLGAVCDVLLEQVAHAETELATEKRHKDKAAMFVATYGAGALPPPMPPGAAGGAASAASVVKGTSLRITKLDESGRPKEPSHSVDAAIFANLAFKDSQRSRELKALAREWLSKPNVL